MTRNLSSDLETSSPSAAPCPNWETIAEEIRCPLCDYNLRGLIEPRCPECGYKFAWQELIDPAHRLHPYLFEHHPERRAWSFRRTLTAGLRPRRFWRALHPAQPSFPRRLVLYWLISIVPLLLSTVAHVGALAIEIRGTRLTNRASEKSYFLNPRYKEVADSLLQEYGSIDNYLDAYYPIAWPALFAYVFRYYSPVACALPAAVASVWPWATLAGLLIFQISMRRARVRRPHILRCICYSADVGFWLGLLMIPTAFALALLWPAGVLGPPRTSTTLSRLEWWICLGGLLVFSARLIVAYRQYLRFPRSIWVVLAAQVIGGLLVLNLFILALALTREQ
jgi:hypothetical protein